MFQFELNHTLLSLFLPKFPFILNGCWFFCVCFQDQLQQKIICPGPVTCLTASPNGLYILAGVAESIYLWEVRNTTCPCWAQCGAAELTTPRGTAMGLHDPHAEGFPAQCFLPRLSGPGV